MKLKIEKTAKIQTYGDINTARYVWIVLHGYGQLVDYFIRKFHVLNPADHFVIAPEGLHRYYLNGTSGRVGASWMTKEERLDDIADNINYLNKVVETYLKDKTFDKRIVLGFSQGASTAARWIQLGDFRPEIFIQWAGVSPPDLKLDSSENSFKAIRNFFVVGNQDPYFQLDYENEIKSKGSEIGIVPEIITFEGVHTIDGETLKRLCEML